MPSPCLPDAFLDQLPVGILIFDQGGRLLQANAWVQRHLQGPIRPGEPNEHLIAPRYRAAFQHALQRALAGDASPNLFYQTLFFVRFLPEKSPRDVTAPLRQTVHIFPLDCAGERVAVVLIEDHAKHLITENRLKAQLARLQTLYHIVSKLNPLESAGLQDSIAHIHRFLSPNHTLLFLAAPPFPQDSPLIYYGDWADQPDRLPTLLPQNSLIRWSLEQKRSRLWAKDLPGDPLDAELRPLDPLTRSAMTVPLLGQGRVLGVLAIETHQPKAFDYEDLGFLHTVAEHLSLGIQLQRSYHRERELRHTAEVLRETMQALASELDPERVQDLILDHVGQVVPFDSATVFLVIGGNRVRVSRHRGHERFGVFRETLEHLELSLAEVPNLKRMAKSQQPLVVPNTAKDPDWIRMPFGRHIKSWVGAPIIFQGQLLGFLTLDHTQPNFYSLQHARTLSIFALQAALALANAYRYERRYHEAITDPLTGLANRRLLQTELEREVARALRFHRPLSLLMLDIDNFKAYNDTYGHPEGDKVLKAVARTLEQVTRRVDIVARYGGEEFVVVLPETDVATARQVAERIRQVIAELHQDPTTDLRTPITLSAGVATLPEHAKTQTDLILAADVALYQAKRQGKNRVMVYQP